MKNEKNCVWIGGRMRWLLNGWGGVDDNRSRFEGSLTVAEKTNWTPE